MKLVTLFPGQGSQRVGMCKKLYNDFKIVKDTFTQTGDCLSFDLYKLCEDGNKEELAKTENSQLAILTASVAAWRAFYESFGTEPAFSAGHSLGEISALTCAGAITFTDALDIVKARGKFMQEAVPLGKGTMCAVRNVTKDVIINCINLVEEQNNVTISNYNAPNQIVISGYTKAVEKTADTLKKWELPLFLFQ